MKNILIVLVCISIYKFNLELVNNSEIDFDEAEFKKFDINTYIIKMSKNWKNIPKYLKLSYNEDLDLCNDLKELHDNNFWLLNDLNNKKCSLKKQFKNLSKSKSEIIGLIDANFNESVGKELTTVLKSNPNITLLYIDKYTVNKSIDYKNVNDFIFNLKLKYPIISSLKKDDFIINLTYIHLYDFNKLLNLLDFLKNNDFKELINIKFFYNKENKEFMYRNQCIYNIGVNFYEDFLKNLISKCKLENKLDFVKMNYCIDTNIVNKMDSNEVKTVNDCVNSFKTKKGEERLKKIFSKNKFSFVSLKNNNYSLDYFNIIDLKKIFCELNDYSKEIFICDRFENNYWNKNLIYKFSIIHIIFCLGFVILAIIILKTVMRKNIDSDIKYMVSETLKNINKEMIDDEKMEKPELT